MESVEGPMETTTAATYQGNLQLQHSNLGISQQNNQLCQRSTSDQKYNVATLDDINRDGHNRETGEREAEDNETANTDEGNHH